MGLAASQARFLAITARKSNCEFQSMQIAQNKLSVSRELADATTDYQNSLNATKLVWDYDCDNSSYLSSACSNAVDLKYNTLMTPSIYNNYQPYLITTRTGRIVLNDKYAAAAKAAGIDPRGQSGTSRSQSGFYNFLNQLVQQGVITEDTNDAIQASKFYVYHGKMDESGKSTYVYDHELNPSNTDDAKLIKDNRLVTVKYDPNNADKTAKGYIEGYDPNAGFGSEPLSKNTMLSTNIGGLAYKLKQDNYSLVKDGITADGKTTYPDKLSELLNNNTLFSDNATAGDRYKLSVNGTLKSLDDAKSMNISDLLLNDVVLAYTLPDNNYRNVEDEEIMEVRDPSVNDVNNFLTSESKFYDNVATIISELGKVLQSAMAGITDDVITNAIKSTQSLYTVGAVEGNSEKKHSTTDALYGAISGANENNGAYVCTTKGNKDNCSAAVSLSNIVDCLLTYVNRYMGGDTSYNVAKKVSDSNFVTDDENYDYPIKSGASTDDKTLMKTDFYMQLYNNLCINGWTTSGSNLDNSQNFEQLLKNGTYFISSINDDGYFYQGRYNSVDCLIEVKDEDAIAQAELEFQRIKANLTYKEDKLDLDMKNLDTEISSLTTELDSVKNLISKSVEKTFTMFQ